MNIKPEVERSTSSIPARGESGMLRSAYDVPAQYALSSPLHALR
jgi:hypothetical protein